MRINKLFKEIILVSMILLTTSCAGWNQHLERRTNIMLDSLASRANQGDVNAQYDLGMKYALGYNEALFKVPQDFVKAAYWLEKASLGNHSRAQFKLSELYFYGKGVTQDPQKALSLVEASKAGDYQLAEDLYNHMNQQGMVLLIKTNPEEAKRRLSSR